jgi:RHS repeat-associated protein
MSRVRLVGVCLFVSILSVSFSARAAATATDLLPASALRGARAIVVGSGLDTGSIAVIFAATGGGTVPAAIVSQSANVLEMVVPPTAASGPVTVTTGSTTLGTFGFTLLADAPFVNVTTLGASAQAHDLFKDASGVAVASSGKVYVTDTLHHQVKILAPGGQVLSIIGTGDPGLVNGPAASAKFKQPGAVVTDAAGINIYVADTGNNVIRRIASDGSVTTYAGSGLASDNDGLALQAAFKQPMGLAFDRSGNLLVADSGNNRIRLITPAGAVTTLAGGVHDGFADGAAAQSLFKQPAGVTVALSGAVFVADTGNNRIRKIENGQVSTVAGTGQPGFNDGSSITAQFNQPSAITSDDAGNLFIADTANHAIRKVTFASSEATVSTISGNGTPGYVDGAASIARFKQPAGIDCKGALFVGDAGNDALRELLQQVMATDLYPRSGAPSGGTDVRIFGVGFIAGTTQVMFGTAPATALTFVSSTEIIATTPAGSIGAVDVKVTTPGGTSTLTAAYTYAAPPTIASITPVKGKTAGGELVTITGTNFIASATSVQIGGAAATQVSVTSPTSLTASTPAGTAGSADVAVATSAGTATKPAAFTYFAPPIITGFAPQQGSAGTVVIITGQNFDPDAGADQVFFSSLPAAVQSASATQLVVLAPNGVTTGRITVTTVGGSTTSANDFSTSMVVSLEITAPATSFQQGTTVRFNAVARLSNGSGTDVSSQAGWSSSNGNVAAVDATGAVSGRGAGSAIVTTVFGGFTATRSVTIESLTLPALVPTPIQRTAVQSLADTVRFLYTGPSAVQTGVATTAIDDQRVSTIRGSIRDRANQPIAGVDITVVRHPELGHTLSRADGVFNIALNGGGTVTLHLAKAGYIEAERAVTTQWNEQRPIDDIVLVGYDGHVTAVAMGASVSQIAQGSRVEDVDGARTATVFLPVGEGATIVGRDGSTSTVTALHIRATEFTVGSTGPLAMPAALPATSAYTYCVELSADEATTGTVRFTKPISIYVENFIHFPVGTVVPVGYYDRVASAWKASANGRVIKILAVVNGLASVDADGDGAADTALQISDDERKQLAVLYAAGQTIWRATVDHFTPFDCNWSILPPTDVQVPDEPALSSTPNPNEHSANQTCGWSVIDCANQVLSESIPIQGTPYSLDYNSSRAGFVQYKTTARLTGASLPPSVNRVELKISVAGTSRTLTFAPSANLNYDFTWDGVDEFGRTVEGAKPGIFEVTYVYQGRYAVASSGQASDPAWAVPALVFADVTRTAAEYRLSKQSSLLLGHLDATTAFGGWTFSPQRFYDGVSGTIYDRGTMRSVDPLQLNETIITTVAGNGRVGLGAADGGADAAHDLFSMAPAPDGAIYFTDAYKIRKLTPDGAVVTLAGTTGAGFTPDGTPALGNPLVSYQMAAGPDGTLYLIDDRTRVRKLVDGAWKTVAGNGTSESAGPIDGVLATSVGIVANGITIGRDGTIYLSGGGRIFRVDPDGIVHTIAGFSKTNSTSAFVDGAPATSVSVYAFGLAVGPDGSIYFADQHNVGRVSPDGRIFHVPFAHGPSTQPQNLAVAADGTLLIGDLNAAKVFAIGTDGITRLLAGTGGFIGGHITPAPTGASRSVVVDYPWEVRVAPDGSLLLLDLTFESIRRITTSFPRVEVAGAPVFTSADGSLAYVFSGGRHTRTLDTLTGVALETLDYDPDGNLIRVTDQDGRITTIERDTAGVPTAIVASNGQRTNLTVAAGRLMAVTEPSGASYGFVYGANGLLSHLTDRRRGGHDFSYDANGLLFRDNDPAGGFIALTRSGSGQTFSVTRTSAEGRTQSYASAVDTSAHETHIHTDTAGLPMTSAFFGGSSTVTTADGTSVVSSLTADPRFGMMAPLTSSTITTGGHTLFLARRRSATLADPKNPFSLTSLTDSFTANGLTWTSTYDAISRSIAHVSPTGRRSSLILDSKGRMTRVQTPSLQDTLLGYDDRGRLATITRGSRVTTYDYDAFDRVASVTDPLHRATGFRYDSANRVITQTLADGRTIGFSYDENGNVTSVTPPSRPAHTFLFTPIDLASSYAPPAAPNGGVTTYHYNRDRQLTFATRPDGQIVSLGYDTAGRLRTLTAPTLTDTFGYDAVGHLMSIAASNGQSLAFAYGGALLTAQQWSGTVNGTVSYAYDNNLRLVSENGVAYSYDNDGLLMSAGALTLTRDPQNASITGTNIGIVSDAYVYNTFGEQSEYSVMENGALVLDEQYVRDDVGRITAQTDSLSVISTTFGYAYDPAGRLSSVTHDGVETASYTYNGNSGRATKTTPWGGTETATYDDQDRLLTYNGMSYTYTANGERSSKTDASGMTSYIYDALGNLRTVVLPNSTQIDYVIDGQNRRVGKKVNGTLVKGWLYGDQLRVVAELDGTGAVVSQFVYGTHPNVPDYMLHGGNTYRFVTDHVGSPHFLIETATAETVEHIEYDEFGNVLFDEFPGFEPFGFAGGLYDADTKLVRFGARDYDPQTGTWTTKDPIGFSGKQTNLYGYTFGDPVNYADPTGTLTIPFFGWVDLGENAGTAALGSYADTLADPNAGWLAKGAAAVGGAFSALWTPCTSDKTFATLAAAYAANEYGGRSFWQYTNGDPAYSSKYLTRGSGWGYPYEPGAEAAERLSLPSYNSGVTVKEIPNSWRSYASGPTPVDPDFGHLGGGIQYVIKR